jgi:hypothetical protein
VKCLQLVPSLMALLTCSLFTGQTNAQSTTNPDFSNVNDIMYGNRTLFSIQDLQVVSVSSPSDPAVYPTVSAFPVTTSNSQPTNAPSQSVSLSLDKEIPNAFSGRMFNQPSATVVVALNGNVGNGVSLAVESPQGVQGASVSPDTTGGIPNGVMADFNQDGYDDLALSYNDGYIVIATATNVNWTTPNSPPQPNLGPSPLRFGPGAQLNVLKAIAAGDFNADGQPEIAGLTVIPKDQPGGGGLELVMYTVDPNSLAITPAITPLVLTTPGASASTPITHVAMARGRFNTLSHDQLAVTFATDSGNTYAEIIDFASSGSLTPTEGPQLLVSNITIPTGYLQLETGQFGLTDDTPSNPSNPYDQIVWHMSSTSDQGRYFWVMTADSNLKLTPHSGVTYNGYPCAAGIQVGNFDNQQPDPLNAGQNEHNPNAQIAFMYCTSDATAGVMNIYSVDPKTFDIVNTPTALALPAGVTPLNSSFVASDLQGRSMVLGEPTKVTLSNMKPTIINAAPPMHADYVTPAGGGAPEVVNVSFIPNGFNSAYELSQQSKTGGSTTHKMSWSAGADESVSTSLEIGSVKAGTGAKFTQAFHAAQDFAGSTANGNNNFTSSQFDVTSTTKLADVVFEDESRLNIWVYPVIGQTVCPATLPNCSDSQKAPLTIQFSGPDQLDSGITSAELSSNSWYQPPWEWGNIFSYPATKSQLALIYPDIATDPDHTLLSSDTGFDTSPSSLKIRAVWSSGSGVDKTGSTMNKFSFDETTTMVAAGGLAGAVKGTTGGSLKLSGSFGFDTLQTNYAQVSASDGIAISSTAGFKDAYSYKVKPFILGSSPNTDIVTDSTQPPQADITTAGPLKTAFTADPLAGGGWWKQAYQLPDIAVNHPSRWALTTTGLPSSGSPPPIPANCGANGVGGIDCVDIAPYYDNTGQPWNPFTSSFFSMRGFFITGADNPGAGPQLGYATAGDKLDLAVRVYDYSLAPVTGVVHVRFYGMPWNNVNNTPGGESFLIGEQKVFPGGNSAISIPGFSDDAGAPLNWIVVHAPAPFDTTPYSNQFLTFWVVVWTEDGNGGLMAEMPGHGLTSIPSTLTQPSDVPVEFATNKLGNKASYSNNVGFYQYAFPVLPKPNSTALGAPPPGNPADTILKNVSAAEKRIRLGEFEEITADLTTQSEGKSNLKVNFYDGDPDKDGTLIGSQLAWVQPGSTTTVRIAYHPTTDGVHRIWAVINKGKANQMERHTSAIIVGNPGHDRNHRDDDDQSNDNDSHDNDGHERD